MQLTVHQVPQLLLSSEEVYEKVSDEKIHTGVDFEYDLYVLFAGGRLKNLSEIRRDLSEISLNLEMLSVPSGKYVFAGNEFSSVLALKEFYIETGVEIALREIDFLLFIVETYREMVEQLDPLNATIEVLRHLTDMLGKGSMVALIQGPSNNFGIPLFLNQHFSKERIQQFKNKVCNSLIRKTGIVDSIEPEDSTVFPELGDPNFIWKMSPYLEHLLQVVSYLEMQAPKMKPVKKKVRKKTSRQKTTSSLSQLSKTNKRFLLKGRKAASSIIRGKEIFLDEKESPNNEDHAALYTVLLDNSKSMTQNYKVAKGLGVLYFILKKVQKGEAVLAFSFYEQDVLGFTIVTQEDKPLEWFRRNILTRSFNGSGTDIAKSLESTFDWFSQNEDKFADTSERHIIIVNDGQDKVEVSSILKQRKHREKIHGIILEENNPSMKSLCQKTKGEYLPCL
jgi:hypothetical protein